MEGGHGGGRGTCILGAMAGNPCPALATPKLYEGPLISDDGPSAFTGNQSSPRFSITLSILIDRSVPRTVFSLRPVFRAISAGRSPRSASRSAVTIFGRTVPDGRRLAGADGAVIAWSADKFFGSPRNDGVGKVLERASRKSAAIASRPCLTPASYAMRSASVAPSAILSRREAARRSTKTLMVFSSVNVVNSAGTLEFIPPPREPHKRQHERELLNTDISIYRTFVLKTEQMTNIALGAFAT